MSAADYPLSGIARAQRLADSRTRAIATLWLFAVLAVGVVIVLLDGASRSPVHEGMEEMIDALQYEAYSAAYVFAGVMLPLVVAWARGQRASWTEALLLWFVFCTVAYTKDFSYVKVPDAPIFITDVLLVVMLLAVFIFPRLRLVPLKSRLLWFVTVFLVLGMIAAARGFASGQEALRILRDLAIVIYPLFLLVGYYVVRSWATMERFGSMVVLGAFLATLNGIAWFVAQPGQRRYIAYGLYLVSALVIVLATRALPGLIRWGLAALLSIGMIVGNARSCYVALAAALLGLVLTGDFAPGRAKLSKWLKPALGAAATALVAVVILSQTRAGSDVVERNATELASGVLRTEQDANSRFRLLAWAEAGYRFYQNPLTGEGFGVPFTFELAGNDSRPHNTYLTVLYKMGVVGEIPLVAFLAYFFVRTWRGLRKHKKSPQRDVLRILLLSQLAMCVYGFANLLLESPFLASLFWLSMGMGLRVVRLFEEQAIAPEAIEDGGAVRPR